MSGLQTRRTGVCFLAQAEDFYLLLNVAKDVARTQPPIERVPGVRRPENEVDHSPPPCASLRISGATSRLPHTPLWFAQGQLYILPYYTFLSCRIN